MKVIYIGNNSDAGNVHSDFTEQGIPFEFHVTETLKEAIELSSEGCKDIICHPKVELNGVDVAQGFLSEASTIHKFSAGGIHLIDGGSQGMLSVSTKPNPNTPEYAVQQTSSDWCRLSAR